MELLFGAITKKNAPNKQWVDYAQESGLTTKTFELEQLERLGQVSPGGGKRMLSLDKTKDGRDMPGIDGFDETGTAVSLKRVLSESETTLESKLRQIGRKATDANATPDFNGTLKDITAMISTENFTINQIKAKIHKLRGTPSSPGGTSSSQGIIKKYFIEGSDGSQFYEY